MRKLEEEHYEKKPSKALMIHDFIDLILKLLLISLIIPIFIIDQNILQDCQG